MRIERISGVKHVQNNLRVQDNAGAYAAESGRVTD